MVQQSILYLMRHLGARDGVLVGKEVQVVGAPEGTTDIVGNGVHLDEEAHLQGSEYVKAEEIGEKLALPSNLDGVLMMSSPKPRADETARHMFIGMCRKYTREVLGLQDLTTPEAKAILSKQGLHKIAEYGQYDGLNETRYADSEGHSDEGNE